jgi:sulfite exporter TauE/SafE
VTTYAVFGLAFGMIGKSFEWFGWQQHLSIAMGALILIMLLAPGNFKKKNELSAGITQFMGRVRQKLGKLMFNGHPGSLYAIGVLNGLLPCGMVYVALAGAVASGDAVQGSAFMALFGLGTLPAMWAVSYFGNMVKPTLRMQARKLFPAFMAVMAILLILRGLNLDIPFVSPALHLSHSTPIDCHD